MNIKNALYIFFAMVTFANGCFSEDINSAESCEGLEYTSIYDLGSLIRSGDNKKAKDVIACNDNIPPHDYLTDVLVLRTACEVNNVEMVEFLLKKGANIVNEEGELIIFSLLWGEDNNFKCWRIFFYKYI